MRLTLLKSNALLFLNNDFELVISSDSMMYSSVEKLYAQMRILLKKSGRVALLMDAKNAIPNQITFDRNVQATDDELYMNISSFKTL